VAPVSPGVRPFQVAVAYIGLAVCVLAFPVVLLLDGTFWGWALGVVLWYANWGAQRLSDRIAYSAENPVMAVGVAGITRMARAFAVFLILMLVGLKVSEDAALAAGGVFVAAFTLDLLGRTLSFQMTKRSWSGGAGE
jgi:hypothetical protein